MSHWGKINLAAGHALNANSTRVRLLLSDDPGMSAAEHVRGSDSVELQRAGKRVMFEIVPRGEAMSCLQRAHHDVGSCISVVQQSVTCSSACHGAWAARLVPNVIFSWREGHICLGKMAALHLMYSKVLLNRSAGKSKPRWQRLVLSLKRMVVDDVRAQSCL